MPTIGPHTFSIVVNGQTLHEYEPPIDEVSEAPRKKAVVYIEAIEGAEFQIHCKSQGHLNFATGHLGIYLWLDNDLLVSRRLTKTYYRQQMENTTVFDHVSWFKDGNWSEQPFQFSNLATTDATTKLDDLKDIARGIGQMRVRVYNVTPPTTGAPQYASGNLRKVVIPEKALKGQPIDMAASYGEAKPTTRRMMKSTSHRVGGYLFECVFKYRSRKALKMLDIIPPTPEPVALHERDVNTLNLNEARELLSRIRRQGGDMGIIQQEGLSIKPEQDSKTLPSISGSSDRKRTATSITIDDTTSDDDDLVFIEAKKIKSTPADQVEVLDLS